MTNETSRTTVKRRVVPGSSDRPCCRHPGGGGGERVSDADRRALIREQQPGSASTSTPKLRTANAYLFYSPYSISDVLAMTYAGARGATADEMARTLRFSRLPAPLHPAFANPIH